MSKPTVVKPLITSNWGDQFGYPAARALLPLVTRFPLITPNKVTIVSFLLFAFGSVSLFLEYPYHLIVAAFLIVAGYVGDDLDGQLARTRGLSSEHGDYLDKTLDVLKIYIIAASLGYAVYLESLNALAIFLAFTACFFFNYRYYIKLETMFSRINADPEYLAKSSEKRAEVHADFAAKEARAGESLKNRLEVLWIKNRMFFAVDEAEFALIIAFFALIGRLDIALLAIALAQVCIAFLRLYQRGSQLHSRPGELHLPLRK
ncbi:MAG: CDP-alcohol phosphatidyltransferase family protein [Patescibacteria group bacterium]